MPSNNGRWNLRPRLLCSWMGVNLIKQRRRQAKLQSSVTCSETSSPRATAPRMSNAYIPIIAGVLGGISNPKYCFRSAKIDNAKLKLKNECKRFIIVFISPFIFLRPPFSIHILYALCTWALPALKGGLKGLTLNLVVARESFCNLLSSLSRNKYERQIVRILLL